MTRHLSLAEVLVMAETVSGTPVDVLAGMPRIRIGLVDSAVQAPMAGFGEVEFHPGLVEKAATLAWHLARNHGLPDGNKRTAWTALNVFLALNALEWQPERPSDDEAEDMILAVAAGEWSEEQLTGCLRSRVAGPAQP